MKRKAIVNPAAPPHKRLAKGQESKTGSLKSEPVFVMRERF